MKQKSVFSKVDLTEKKMIIPDIKKLTSLLNELYYSWVGEENAKRFPLLSDKVFKSSKTCGSTDILIQKKGGEIAFSSLFYSC